MVVTRSILYQDMVIIVDSHNAAGKATTDSIIAVTRWNLYQGMYVTIHCYNAYCPG